MKRLLLIAFSLFTMISYAQMKEGRVVYERTMQMPRLFISDANLEGQLPKSKTDQYELLFGNNQSLWQYLPNANNEDPSSFSANGVVLRFSGGANEKNFYDFAKGIHIDQTEAGENNYIVTDTIKKLDWKITGETKTVLGYTANKAVSEQIIIRNRMSMENGEMKEEKVPDTLNVTAWFTKQIPVPAGPDFQGTLPGLILELNMNNGQTVFNAIGISPHVNLSKIKEPKNGKKMTASEFAVERKKIMEEMRKNMPAGNVIRMSNLPTP